LKACVSEAFLVQFLIVAFSQLSEIIGDVPRFSIRQW
jgi:hypothetical protein